jgi:hypothetical protein
VKSWPAAEGLRYSDVAHNAYLRFRKKQSFIQKFRMQQITPNYTRLGPLEPFSSLVSRDIYMVLGFAEA